MKDLAQRLVRGLEIAQRERRALRLMRWGRRAEAVVELAQTLDGEIDAAEIALLYRVARLAEAPGQIAQVGVGSGRATAVLAMALEDADAPCKLFAIDPMTGKRNSLDLLRENLRRLKLTSRVETLLAEPDRAAEVLRERGEPLRLLYLDGARSYEGVVAEIQALVPLVREGGTVALQGCSAGGEHPEVWLAFQDELGDRVKILERIGTLLVTRLLPGAARREAPGRPASVT